MRNWLLAGVLFLISIQGYSQAISDLKSKKEKTVKEIEYTTRLLNEVEKSRKTSLDRLQLLNNKIDQRNELISTITGEIRIYDQCVDDNEMVVKMLQSDLKTIKAEYANMIRSAYRNRNTADQLLFLLSAVDLTQAYRRYQYLKKYTVYRQNQAKIMQSVQTVLNLKTADLEQQKQTKQKLVAQNINEKEKLVVEKTRQNNEFQNLQKERRDLQGKLAQQRKAEQQLENEIQQIIDEETKKDKEAGGSGFALTPEEKLVGNNFEQNKSRLPWPVERGVITEHFGFHQHPVLTNIQIRNNGISIATEPNAKVRAVFNGEVSRVFGITGGNTAVIIRHGKYLTVYSNLRESEVNIGDKVTTKQEIGTVYTDPEDHKSILKFQIWLGNKKLDPEKWIGQ